MVRKRMSDGIVAEFLQKIGAGEIPEGSPLPTEATLCGNYGVSRSVVREAIGALCAKGFIRVSQGSASTVAPRNQWHVLDSAFLELNSGREYFTYLQEARELLEPQIAALAAANALPEDLAELDALQREFDVANNPDHHAELDIRFHQAIAESTKNPVVASLHESISGLGYRTRLHSAAIPGAIERARFWHSRILECLIGQDSAGAKSAMRLHLRQVRDELVIVSPQRDNRTESKQ
jgi:DNA-binding FadR family transcriptional regulator